MLTLGQKVDDILLIYLVIAAGSIYKCRQKTSICLHPFFQHMWLDL